MTTGFTNRCLHVALALEKATENIVKNRNQYYLNGVTIYTQSQENYFDLSQNEISLMHHSLLLLNIFKLFYKDSARM